MPCDGLNTWLQALGQPLTSRHQRVLLQCVGSLAFAQQIVSHWLAQHDVIQHLIISNNEAIAQSIPFNKTQQLLGQEFDLVLFDAAQGLDVDAFLRVASLVRAPGLLLLSHPTEADWLKQPDSSKWQNAKQGNPLFLRYLLKQLQQSPAVIRCVEGEPLLTVQDLPASPKTAINPQTACSDEQYKILQAMQSFVTGNDHSVCALLAQRGRGKSTLIGQLLSSELLSNQRFVLISQAKKATQQCLNYLQSAHNTRYKAVDDFLANPVSCDCIVVDEAATIPIGQLQQLLAQHHKVLLTSTKEGYEGTGSGFELQLLKHIPSQALLSLELTQAMRWGQNDVLEHSLKHIFMLQQQPLSSLDNAAEIQISPCAQETLLEDTALLQQVFQLLKTSHYRTQASDLKTLLDNPDLSLFIAHNHSGVYGVALVVQEGGLDKALSHDILYGTRRPQGHLLAQTLTAQAGVADFATFSGWRIQRIAVHEQQRKQGIGTKLLQAIEQQATQQGQDYVGASFALNQQSLQFWQHNHYQLVHIGVGQGTATGLPSVVFLKVINHSLKTIQAELQQQLTQQFNLRLLTHFKTMPPQQVQHLIQVMPPFAAINPSQYEPYLKGYQGFEYALPGLQAFTLFVLQQSKLSTRQAELLIRSILQYQAPETIIQDFALSGKKQLHQQIKQVLMEVL